MKIKDIRMVLRRHLGESFDSSKLAEYFEEYYVKHSLPFGNADSIPFLNIKKLQAIIFILEKVRLCFSNEEFSKLVCMSIVRYSHMGWYLCHVPNMKNYLSQDLQLQLIQFRMNLNL